MHTESPGPEESAGIGPVNDTMHDTGADPVTPAAQTWYDEFLRRFPVEVRFPEADGPSTAMTIPLPDESPCLPAELLTHSMLPAHRPSAGRECLNKAPGCLRPDRQLGDSHRQAG